MHNFCLLFLFVNLLTINISAQEKSNWYYSLELGVNYSNSSEDTSPLKKECPILPKIGFSFEYNFLKDIYIQSGIAFSMKGIKSSGETDHLKASVKLNQQVIQLPILINYKFLVRNFGIGLGAGIYYSYGVGGKTEAIGNVNGDDINIKKDTFGNILKHQDLGLNFKLSSEFNLFLLNLSYEYGLRNIGKANVMGANLDYENRIASISLGYLF